MRPQDGNLSRQLVGCQPFGACDAPLRVKKAKLMSALNKGGGVNMLVAYWLERSEEAHAQHGGGFSEQYFYCKSLNS